MPVRILSFRQWMNALLGAVMMVGVYAGSAFAAEWPLVLRETWYNSLGLPSGFAPFPKGRPMDLLIDTWEHTSGDVPGGDMIITSDTIEFRDSTPPFYSPYKVLYTAPNYVLLAVKETFSSGNQWTSFYIYAFRGGDSDTRYWTLIENYCTDLDMERPEPFDWPKEKLLKKFKSSRCLAGIKDDWSYGSLGNGWNKWLYQRAKAKN